MFWTLKKLNLPTWNDTYHIAVCMFLAMSSGVFVPLGLSLPSTRAVLLGVSTMIHLDIAAERLNR